MKKSYFLALSLWAIFLFINFSTAYAQYIPVQGKLIENNVPVTGQRNFNLIIKENETTLWEETQNNVEVLEGIYALRLGMVNPLPTGLFANRMVVNLEIRVNGSLLNTLNVDAPFESDPSIPEELKDGVAWGEVSDKPDLDVSNSNELQELSISGNELTLSSGNEVTLPVTPQGVTIPYDLAVGPEMGGLEEVVPLVADNNMQQGMSFWQSFRLDISGALKTIKLKFGNPNNTRTRIRLYEGKGITSQAIFDKSFNSSAFGAAVIMQTIPITTALPPALMKGMDYTLLIEGRDNSIEVAANTADPYANGYSNLGMTTDLSFGITVEEMLNHNLLVTEETVEMNVPVVQTSGRYKDKYGYVTPVGSIQAFAGNTPPEGWFFCDGTSISRTIYADLFDVIGVYWGTEDANSFRVPDLRGQFLRGVSDATGNDPDTETRYSLHPGGNTQNNVGSYQDAGTGSHFHYMVALGAATQHQSPNNHLSQVAYSPWVTDSERYSLKGTTTAPTQLKTSEGGNSSETRPKNAYVHFIIKY